MTEFTLRLSVPKLPSKSALRGAFYWTAQGPSSFEGPYGPRLAKLGPVRQQNLDFVRLAVLVFAADRTTPRSGGGTNWSQRSFSLTVPVADPGPWSAIQDELASLLGFLTGDEWSLNFNRARPPKETAKALTLPTSPRRVVLVSGGADSAVGALVSRSQLTDDEGHVLVSHVGAKNLAPVQREVIAAIERLFPGPEQVHIPVGLRRRSKQIDNQPFANETSSRSRSLLFLSLGLAAASIHEIPLWIPENGFASLNPPLAADRRGSLSTRTTHPAFLEGLATLLRAAGAHAEIINPFEDMTKGEMFAKAVELTDPAAATSFLSSTHSCGMTGQRAFGIPLGKQCGVCFGCVVRRAAFKSAGIPDASEYIARGVRQDVDTWLDRHSVERAMRGFLRRGVTTADIAAMSLPGSYPTAEAVDLCKRAIAELRAYLP